MNNLLEIVKNSFDRFEEWFNDKFGWFFTNGMKKVEEQHEA